MKRGEVWTLQDDRYASKARPVVIVQGCLEGFDSVIVCLFTSFHQEDLADRIAIEPTGVNGLQKTSYVMVDKLLTVRQRELGHQVGSLNQDEMLRVTQALARILAISLKDLPPNYVDK